VNQVNEKGIALLLVLFMMMFLSMVTIHLAVLYKQEKQFLGLEQEQQRLDQLILNGKIEMINLIDLTTIENEVQQGEIRYPEGIILYEIKTDGNVYSIYLKVETIRQYAKQASFTYNREMKMLEEWSESIVWN